MPLFDLAALAVKVKQGTHIEDKNVLSFKTDKLLIESPENIPTDVDGEHGQKLPLEFDVLPNRLNIFTSKGE